MDARKLARIVSALCLAMLAVGSLATGLLCDEESPAPTTIAQDNEQKARIHYLAGDAALKSGDVLTAIVEWETTLTLKPSSAFTAKCLVAAAAKLGPDGKDAYAHFVNATDLQRQGKLDEAQSELNLALTYKPKGSVPQCLTQRAAELADLKKNAAKLAQESQPKTTETTTAAAAPKSASTAKSKPQAKSSASTAKKSTTTHKKSSSSSYRSSHAPRYVPHYTRRYITRGGPRTGKLVYVPGYIRNGKYVPGHFAFRATRR
jgi:tetratricopeptide (TPR) repeat protein